ncbi:MAG: aminomethyl-transferring glycine dehydrogenase subunit GcvPA [Planctomycetota bacterium]
MSYVADSPDDFGAMLQSLGISDVESLFSSVPDKLKLDRPLAMPPAMAEPELDRELRLAAAKDVGVGGRTCFLGGGAYDHFIPAVVDEIASRGEYYTAYTPYQAECSQGTLQAFFEYQSLIAGLTGMEVSNASLYEGATAVSEAAFMAMRVTGRTGKVVIAGSVHPEYRDTLRTYLSRSGTELVELPCPDGFVDPVAAADAVDDETACLVIQHPNAFGGFEEARELCAAAKAASALAVIAFDPLSLGLIAGPGELGADIAVAEGQPLGVPLQYGGPYLGVFACRAEYVRKMPGRLISKSTDKHGRDCFVLSLQTREQHIRRGKATSNICTNQGLLALRSTVYLSLLGPAGLREVGEACLRNTRYAAARLADVPGMSLAFDRPVFKEFVLRTDRPASEVAADARAAGFDIGPAWSRFGPDAFPGCVDADRLLTVAVTESRNRDEIDRLADALIVASGGRSQSQTALAGAADA